MNMLTCMCAKSLQLCLTLYDATDCSLPGSSVHGILQARILIVVMVVVMVLMVRMMANIYETLAVYDLSHSVMCDSL